jgi:hypothetical protein
MRDLRSSSQAKSSVVLETLKTLHPKGLFGVYVLVIQQVGHKSVGKESVAVWHVGGGVLNVEQKARQLLLRLLSVGVRPFTNALLKGANL